MPGGRGPKLTERVDIDFTLRRVFGKQSFRPSQREVIETALAGYDVFLQAATSFGKSLCFQLPAVVDHGTTIVVSPLLALMNNQVTALRKAGLKVETINSTTPRSEKQKILDDLRCGHPLTRILYVTPELCTLDFFRNILQTIYSQGELSRIAIDEAHCISEWGHDFRKSFQELSFFRKQFPDVPIMCVTATATSQVREDIISTLGLSHKALKLFIMTTCRPNLHYEVRFKSDEVDHYDDFLKWIRSVHKRRSNGSRASTLKAANVRLDNVSGIIYTLYRKDCELLSSRLVSDGIGAKPFHAGLPAHVKEATLQGWVDNQIGYDVIVATTAFGMGIDKNDVRYVVHWQLPKSFEGFYQEAGRGGRDGKASISIVYYSREDRDRATMNLARDQEKHAFGGLKTANRKELVAQHMSRGLSLQSLVNYCESTEECRHAVICRYFADDSEPLCDLACDWHKDAAVLRERKRNGLASEEWCSTHREANSFTVDDYD